MFFPLDTNESFIYLNNANASVAASLSIKIRNFNFYEIISVMISIEREVYWEKTRYFHLYINCSISKNYSNLL